MAEKENPAAGVADVPRLYPAPTQDAVERELFPVDASLLAAAREIAAAAQSNALRGALDRTVQGLLAAMRSSTPERRDALRLRLESHFIDLLASLPEAAVGEEHVTLWHDLHSVGISADALVDACAALYDEMSRSLRSSSRDGADEESRRAAYAALRRPLLFRLHRIAAVVRERLATPTQSPQSVASADRLLDRSRVLHAIRGLAENARRGAGVHAVLSLEMRLTDFSPDAFVVDAIDGVIADIAAMTQPSLRASDMIGRVGMTELVFLLPGLRDPAQAVLAANKIARVLEAAERHPVMHAARPTLGIALIPDHGTDPEVLLRHAGMARAEARARGERYLLYTPDLNPHGVIKPHLQSEFRAALRENEFSLALQAQYDVTSGVIESCEALLRWRSRAHQVVPSDVAVEVAERIGLASSLTAWVLNSALRLSSELLHRGIDISVSVNIGAGDLLDPELPDLVDQGLRTWRIRPRRLTLEITENAMIRGIDRVLATLARLKELGIELSIDDFGIGYSSLAYLGRLPVDELKIDKTFVQKMHRGRQEARMVAAIVDLARNFDLRTVAEGVEDERTFEALCRLGCHRIQGYYVAQPMPMEDFGVWMTTARGR